MILFFYEVQMDIGERLKKLRKVLNLNQSEFAKKIGMAQNSLSLIETGKNILTQQNINLIGLTFNVSKKWLELGEGEMFVSDNPKAKEFLELYEQLTPEMQDVIFEHVKTLAEAEKRQRREAEK
jgi:hypothetical protein cdifQCD-6_20775|nr:MAG TPA: helix-turn-helix domain protein [Caudoviricetes sp.]